CVRIIHGKGLQADNAAPVLKNLMDPRRRQRNDGLACQSGPRR
ncbi:SMR domain protein, partial [Xanthomonas oryzae pv. oryzae]